MHSVGFIVAETAERLTLAPHVGGQNQENKQFAGVITLPKRQIISISSCRVLELELNQQGGYMKKPTPKGLAKLAQKLEVLSD